MSFYTDREHERGVSETLYWMKKTPKCPSEKYEYGEYQYRLKDYREAVKFYRQSAEEGYIPAMYKLAYCMRNQLGSISNIDEENELFKKVILHDKEVIINYYVYTELASEYTAYDSNTEEITYDEFEYVQQNLKLKYCDANYRMGMCYSYGYGLEKNEKQGIIYFKRAKEYNVDALYEIGKFYKEGKAGYIQENKKAEEYFIKAYYGFCEEAIFEIFNMYKGDFNKFKYIREIKEAYSFKLGRLIRVAELKENKEYFNRLAKFYENGYPGDTGERLERFKDKAKKYYKKEVECDVV